jgi:hypothetical protein
MIVRMGGLCPRERRRRSSHHHHGRHKGRHQQQTYALNHAFCPFLSTSTQRFSSQAVSGRMWFAGAGRIVYALAGAKQASGPCL